MKWLEFIKVRSAGNREQLNVSELLNRVAERLKTPGLVKSEVYAHASIPGDLGLILFWDTDRPRFEGSDLALNLVQELKRSGLVDHSVWIMSDERSGHARAGQ